MKIFSYNVNGIRAAIKKGFLEWLSEYSPDIICLQEIKANSDQLDLDLFNKIGYKYNYWFSAKKKGYSGVAILSKHKPISVHYGTGIDHMDFEGRNLRLNFKKFSVMSLYLPSGTNIQRLEYKFRYMEITMYAITLLIFMTPLEMLKFLDFYPKKDFGYLIS